MATLGVFLANGFGIGAWAVEVPRIKENLVLSDTSLGIALFAFALGAIVAMPLAGQLAPRFGSGRATALLGAAFVVALPLPAFAPNLATLFIALFALGAANGALDVSMNGHASTIETQWKSPIMSSFHASWSAGGLLGAATGAMLQKGGIGVVGGLVLPDVLIAALIAAAAALALRDLGPRAAAASNGFAWPSAAVMKPGDARVPVHDGGRRGGRLERGVFAFDIEPGGQCRRDRLFRVRVLNGRLPPCRRRLRATLPARARQ